MSLETISDKRDRIYQRKFDHDEARLLHSAGESYSALADRYGVTIQAVRRVCDERVRSDMEALTKEYMRTHFRSPCLGGCGRLVLRGGGKRSGYCRCCSKSRRDAARTDIREGELRCSKCGEWKQDASFPTYRPVAARRGRNSQCRSCHAAVRREYRRDHPMSAVKENARTRVKRGASRMQTYVVLSPNGDQDYKEIARVSAVSPTHAIEKSAASHGRYIAVPMSRFAVMEVEPVQAFKVVRSSVENEQDRRDGEAVQATASAE